MKRIALFAFNGDPACFIHVLLNGLDMKAKGLDVRIIMEGSATSLLFKLTSPSNPLNNLWEDVKRKGIIDGVCKGCAHKFGTVDDAVNQDLPLLADLSGHPSIAGYMEKGYQVLSF